MSKPHNHHLNGTTRNNPQAHEEQHRTWSRRQFLWSAGLTAIGSGLTLGGSSVQAMPHSPLLSALQQADNERILVIINLSGGNDGLNTIIPRGNDIYYAARPTLAIPEYNLFAMNDDFGMPNTMLPLQAMWNEGKMAVVHNVAYPNQNLSHFRSSDIWATASDEDVMLRTGWIGRFLENNYPAYTLAPPENPIGLQIGVQSNILFDGQDTNYGLSITNPAQFYQIALTGQLHSTENLPDCSYGEEVLFMRQMVNSTVRYASSIQRAFTESSNQVGYTNDNLSQELSIVARLIKGNLGTKVYLVTAYGYDTHASQAGDHAYLMTELANAVNAFYNDLAASNHSQNVLMMTISEFGRRVEENGSQGTDHGASAPMLFFGDLVNGGFYGTPSDIVNLDEYGNVRFTTDFREVYLTVLRNWFCLDLQLSQAIIGKPFDPIDNLLPNCDNQIGANALNVLLGHNPSPSNSNIMEIKYAIRSSGIVKLQIQDLLGNTKATLVNAVQEPNSYTISFNPYQHGLQPGHFIYRLDTGGKTYSRRMRFW
ncbi:MAG: DUF1501 domain-containing protein [Chitinophagales bacterium]|nr:DUF1501 domain-containing protein [Chitinophagales bacterium]